jgi:chromosome segregation ATPase
LFECEQKFGNTLNSLRQFEKTNLDFEADNKVLNFENEELRATVRDIKDKYQALQNEYKSAIDKKANHDFNLGNLHKDIEELSEENERMASQIEKLSQQLSHSKANEASCVSFIKDFGFVINKFNQDLNRNTIASQSFLGACTPKLKEIITVSCQGLDLDDLENKFEEICKQLKNWVFILLEEVEKDVLKIIKLS